MCIRDSFHTAVDIATEVIDRIHTTAGSHSRVMCIEIIDVYKRQILVALF